MNTVYVVVYTFIAVEYALFFGFLGRLGYRRYRNWVFQVQRAQLDERWARWAEVTEKIRVLEAQDKAYRRDHGGV